MTRGEASGIWYGSEPDSDDEPTQDDEQEPSTDPAVDPGDEPDTAHIPYQPPSVPDPPVIRPPDGTERPWPSDPERPDPEHAPENEPPEIDPGEEAPEAL